MELYYQKEIETASPEQIREGQNERFLNTLGHVWENNKYYKKKMLEKGVIPEDIHSIDDMWKLPYLTKDGAFAYGYDNARSLTIKCQYIIEHNLAGGMYWEYADDDNMGTERHTVYDCLIGNASQSGIEQPEASAPQTRKLRTLQTYDLLGRAVTNPHQGGIYFKKGSPLGSRLTTQRKALTNNRF